MEKNSNMNIREISCEITNYSRFAFRNKLSEYDRDSDLNSLIIGEEKRKRKKYK